jgi:Spy/CpxP family protein refolding chaperone
MPRKQEFKPVILAGASNEVLHCAASPVEWLEAAADGQGSDAKKFTMTAYTGGAMRVGLYYDPVVIDLSGLQAAGEVIPALKDHDIAQIVGHGTPEITAQTVKMSGLVSGGGDAAQEVRASSERGFPWKASVGVQVLKREYVSGGAKAKANGKTFVGPVNIIRGGILQEISFVAIGADGKTRVSVAATAAGSHKESTEMEFNEWVIAKGFQPDSLTDNQRQFLQAMFDQEQKAPEPKPQEKVDAAAKPAEQPKVDVDAMIAQAEEGIRAAASREVERLGMIEAKCSEYADRIDAPKLAELKAKAIKDKWGQKDIELELLREARPKAPAIHASYTAVSGEVLEAACAISGKLEDVEKHYKPEALEAAHKRFKGDLGLQELLLEAAWANGYTGRTARDVRALLRAAFSPDVRAQMFSHVDISGILSNVANKFLLAGYSTVESVWRNICAIRSVRDFKTVTSYRLTGSLMYEKVEPNGELPHGSLGEESYTNKADTYGKMLAIGRTDIINDDLGAITQVPRALGRGSGLKVNDVFWTVFCDNATFFSAANSNYYADAAAALSVNSLTYMEQLFMDQTDADGKPLGVVPKILLVPTGLSALAAQLYNSLEIRDTTSSTKYPVNNPHAQKFRPEVSAYLGNAAYGNSQLAWYLLADPMDIPVIEGAFLNGQESPTIETADADFNVLGIQMRGYHDFGFTKQDPKGGCKSKGAA